ncbi:MAG: hypothetical protein ACM3NF_08325 [Gemmatimonadota bacterium]
MRAGNGPGDAAASAVGRALLQRGLSLVEWGAEGHTLLPCLKGPREREAFFGLLRSYAFRLFLRDILALRDRFLPERLGPFFTPESVEAMAEQAERLGLIRRGKGGRIRLLADGAADFGDTFEWFVAETVRREFAADALWGVKIGGLPCGGDFDVLALASGRLLYIETKTSPPKHIELSDVCAFVDRVGTLSPDFAVILVDTHLRMKDKLVPLLSEALRTAGEEGCELARVERETFSWDGRIFVTNAKRDVGGNLAVCLRSYFLERFFD